MNITIEYLDSNNVKATATTNMEEYFAHREGVSWLVDDVTRVLIPWARILKITTKKVVTA